MNRSAAELVDECGILEFLRLHDFQSGLEGVGLHGRGHKMLAATSGFVGSGDHGGYGASGFMKAAKARHGEIGSTEKNYL
mgnify:CR=1 FL=1